MLTPLLVTFLSVVAQSASVQTVVAARHDAAQPRASATADSLRALRSGRRAQETFEFQRRLYLPREYGVGSHHCDVRIGRWCIWNDETNDRKPPPESPRITQARDRLLAILDTIGAQFPGDEWVAAQQVRYLVEAKRYAEAIRIAERCSASGSAYLCRAFAGVALHDSGAVAAADSAFSAALGAMPEAVRCRWTDISVLLDDDVADRYAHASCADRRPIEETFWRLTNPLYLRQHDFRNEYLARVTQAEMQKNSRTPMGSPTEDAFRETGLRYGFDTWFVRDDPPMGSMNEPSIAGYREGGPGFNFVPSYAVFDSLVELRPSDWDLKLRSARSNYAPAYARHFRSLDRHQIALFRRGDSALVVAAYDASDDTALTRRPLEAGLFAAAAEPAVIRETHGTTVTQADARGVLTTTASWRPMLVSLELLQPESKTAARARYGVRPPSSNGRVSVSDLLMFAPSPGGTDSTPHRLADALPLVLHTERASASHALGLFWETYGVRPEGESFGVSLTIDRIQDSWMRRAAVRMHLATAFSPLRVEWQEVPDRGDHIATRAVSLDLSRLSPGRYEIILTVTPKDEPSVVSRRELLVDR